MVEILALRGLVTDYVLFFMLLGSRRVEIAGITPNPHEAWMPQIARNVTMEEWGSSRAADTLSITAIRNTRTRFAGSSNRVTSSPLSFPPEVRTHRKPNGAKNDIHANYS